MPRCRWLARLGMYDRKRALTFQTPQDLKEAIDALWDPTDEFYGMPRAPAGALTMVVPDEAMPLFRARRFKFVDHPVIPATRGARRPRDLKVGT